MAYQGKSQHFNSMKFFEESLKHNPNNIAAMNNYANSLKAVGKFEQSKDLYEKILKVNPNYIKAYNNYANLKTSYNDYDGAIDLYIKAIKLLKRDKTIPISNCLEFMFSLAVAYQGHNNVAKSKDVIDEILSINASHCGAHKLKTSILKYSYEDKNSMEHLKAMEKLNDIKKLNDNEKIDLFFSLGKVYEDLKEFDKAFFFLKEANQLRMNKFGSNLENEKKLFNHIVKTFENINLEESNKNIPSKK